MNTKILPVFQTVEFLRVVSYGEGKRGKFAVAIVRYEQNEYTTLFADSFSVLNTMHEHSTFQDV